MVQLVPLMKGGPYSDIIITCNGGHLANRQRSGDTPSRQPGSAPQAETFGLTSCPSPGSSTLSGGNISRRLPILWHHELSRCCHFAVRDDSPCELYRCLRITEMFWLPLNTLQFICLSTVFQEYVAEIRLVRLSLGLWRLYI